MAISADGRLVAFMSRATNLVPGTPTARGRLRARPADRDDRAGERRRRAAPRGTAIARGLSISGDGRFVVFASGATNLVPGDTNGLDVFVRDRRARHDGTGQRGLRRRPGQQGQLLPSDGRAITPDGRFVVVRVVAADLVPGDTNERQDVFVRDRRAATDAGERLLERHRATRSSSDPSAISAGRALCRLLLRRRQPRAGDTNGAEDVFVRTR